MYIRTYKSTQSRYQTKNTHIFTIHEIELADFIFTDVRPTMKSTKILSHENFPLYGIQLLLIVTIINAKNVPVGMYIRTCVCMCVWVYTHVYVRMCTWVCICVYECLGVCFQTPKHDRKRNLQGIPTGWYRLHEWLTKVISGESVR